MTAKLPRAGRRISPKKVEQLMRERDIRGITRRKRRHLVTENRLHFIRDTAFDEDRSRARTGTARHGELGHLRTPRDQPE